MKLLIIGCEHSLPYVTMFYLLVVPGLYMLIRFSVLVLLYFTARVLFFVFNRQALQDAPLAALTAAFLTGFRADLLVIIVTNGILLFRRYCAVLSPVVGTRNSSTSFFSYAICRFSSSMW